MDIRKYSIAAIPADGIGVEVIDATIEVLEALQQETSHDVSLVFLGGHFGESSAITVGCCTV